MQVRFAKIGLLFALACPAGCALSQGSVTRVTDGVEREARPVSAEAYAYYSRAVLFEAKGDARAALLAYKTALREDPNSAELYARAASVECTQSRAAGDASARAAQVDFARAIELDPTSSQAWSLSARCAARQASLREALDRARKAAAFDPSSVSCSLLVAQYAEALGDLSTARAWLDGLVASAPTSREALHAFAAFAKRQGDRGRQLHAERQLTELGSAKADVSATLHRALVRADLKAARQAATELRMPAAELALRAVRESNPTVATEQAQLTLAADPDDANAWIAALAAADLARDRSSVEHLVTAAPIAASTPNPLALELLGELLARLVGDDARAAWDAAGAPVKEKDRRSNSGNEPD
jgi:Tfp pilus assembly protein PilF